MIPAATPHPTPDVAPPALPPPVNRVTASDNIRDGTILSDGTRGTSNAQRLIDYLDTINNTPLPMRWWDKLDDLSAEIHETISLHALKLMSDTLHTHTLEERLSPLIERYRVDLEQLLNELILDEEGLPSNLRVRSDPRNSTRIGFYLPPEE